MTKIVRALLAAALGAAMAAPAALAQDQLTIMAPAAPGGGWDGTARAMQEVLQATGIVKSVQVENVAGAGGTRGIAQFVRRSGDSKQWMVSGLVMVGAVIANKSPIGLNDVTPIARLTSEWQAIAVTPESKIKTMQDLAAALRANVAAVSWGGGSAGGTDHITAALLAKAAGADAARINYVAHSGGGESLAAILGNHVTLGVNSASEFMPLVEAKKLRIIGVSSAARIPGIDAPTFKETGLDVVIGNWRAIMAAPKLKDSDRDAVAQLVDRMVKSDAWKAKLKERGWENNYLPGPAFAKFIADEQKQVGEILAAVGIGK
ncbi:MAG: tripartite tricarboxylate transporter substrate binding protein [Alphaproteobacteria bacterium]|nr:tripartite tricarboxylate transporter substrate binding protein [Alphaproteobacteria bacterium]